MTRMMMMMPLMMMMTMNMMMTTMIWLVCIAGGAVSRSGRGKASSADGSNRAQSWDSVVGVVHLVALSEVSQSCSSCDRVLLLEVPASLSVLAASADLGQLISLLTSSDFEEANLAIFAWLVDLIAGVSNDGALCWGHNVALDAVFSDSGSGGESLSGRRRSGGLHNSEVSSFVFVSSRPVGDSGISVSGGSVGVVVVVRSRRGVVIAAVG